MTTGLSGTWDQVTPWILTDWQWSARTRQTRVWMRPVPFAWKNSLKESKSESYHAFMVSAQCTLLLQYRLNYFCIVFERGNWSVSVLSFTMRLVDTVYHGECIETWLNQYRHICPLCKGPITAQRKKRAAARQSERTRLLAAADDDVRISYGASLNAGARGQRNQNASALFLRSM